MNFLGYFFRGISFFRHPATFPVHLPEAVSGNFTWQSHVHYTIGNYMKSLRLTL
jgi:hypothetical protein